MTYQVRYRPSAAKALAKLDRPVQRRLQAAVELLAETPFPPSSTVLTGGDGERRVRVGDWRVIYEVNGDQLVVLVLALGHRGSIYRR